MWNDPIGMDFEKISLEFSNRVMDVLSYPKSKFINPFSKTCWSDDKILLANGE